LPGGDQNNATDGAMPLNVTKKGKRTDIKGKKTDMMPDKYSLMES
jgi:hypothetical protein